MTPLSRIRPRVSNRVSTIVGARPERRLVEQQHVGPGDERARDRELLLLAARERARVALREVGHDREELAHPGQVVGRALLGAAPGEPEPQVLVDGQRGEDVPALGDEGDAGAGDVLRPAAERPPVRAGSRPPRRGTSPMIAWSVLDLPAPLGPIRPTISPRSSFRSSPRTAGTPP